MTTGSAQKPAQNGPTTNKPTVMTRLRHHWPMLEGQLRLWSGLTLFTYVLLHLTNHAVGLISLDAMEWVRQGHVFLLRNIVGSTLLYGALAIHVTLVLARLWRRRSLRMPPGESAQIILGLMIPSILAYHVVGTRLAHEMFGVNDLYSYVLVSLMIFDPKQGILQVFALFLVWGHGCAGLYFWLRLKSWFPRWRNYLAVASVAIPILSLGGYISGAREASLLYLQDETWAEQMRQSVMFAASDQVTLLLKIVFWIEIAVPIMLVALIILRLGRSMALKRVGRFWHITWPDGQKHPIRDGQTVLDVARNYAVPHASVCGGRGRCSTCRIRVLDGIDQLSPADEQETRVLSRLVPEGQEVPDNLRLACQCKPQGPITIMPLLPPNAGARQSRSNSQATAGQEKIITVLFADLRGFTAMSENRLPFDTVFMLNQYFHDMGQAIEGAGGYLDKFIGDGIMALFGLHTDPATGAKQAIEATRNMIDALEQLNAHLASELDSPLRIGVGLHTGPAIVGEMGYGNGRALTAIGDTVNTASRVESATKEHQTPALIAESVWQAAGLPPTGEKTELTLRGKSDKLMAWKI